MTYDHGNPFSFACVSTWGRCQWLFSQVDNREYINYNWKHFSKFQHLCGHRPQLFMPVSQLNSHLALSEDSFILCTRILTRTSREIMCIIPLHDKFLQFDWLRAVVFQLNLKYLHVKITNLLRVVV